MSGLTIKQRLALELNRQIVNETARKHPLRQLFWECTLRCNMHCRHCGSDCKVSSLTQDMPFEDFRRVLERVREVYEPHKVFVIITGGEPLMRPDIVECGRAIYDMEFPWGIVSNGRLMTLRKIDELLGAGMHCATISLDGMEEDHNWMRGTTDGFKYASRAIEILAAEQSIKFDVVTCVNRRNIGRLPEIKEYLISLGLKEWRLFNIFPSGRAASDPELQLTPEEFRKMIDFINDTRTEGRIRLSYGCEGFLGSYEGKVRDYLFSCQAGLSVGSVLADGTISACASIRSDYGQGNIFEDDFVDVWEKRFKVMRDRSWTRESGKCSECRWWRYCLGGGMHMRDSEGRLVLCHLDKL